MMELRRCKTCGVERDLAEFNLYNAERNLRRWECTPCRGAKNKARDHGNLVSSEGTRECRKCGTTKPLIEFELYRPGRGMRRHECAECRKARHTSYATKSAAEIRRMVEMEKLEVAPKTIRHRAVALAYYYRMQDAAIRAYGGYRCACCGETEPLFMTLDHIENDGFKHRMEIGAKGGHQFYKWLRDRGYPPGFQVLCENCNKGKHRNKGVCPHHTRKA